MSRRQRRDQGRSWFGICFVLALFGQPVTVHVDGACSCMDAPWRRWKGEAKP